MDYYSFDSEVIESLNFLRPPVKRSLGDRNRDFSVYCNSTKNNFQVLREFGHKLSAKKLANSYKQTSHEDSSTSLILKKTSESQILKHYSVVSYTSLRCQEQPTLRETKQSAVNDKPLIKVTVIPKSDQNPGSKLFRKQKIVTKTIQTTSSNHENSIQTKNVYLVVAGRKKEKIYEIKTTGSEKLEKEAVKDDTIENLSNFKQFIKTLHMERKRKKDKRKDSKIDKRNETQVNICETKQPIVEHVCKCSPGSEHNVVDARPGKSRVRIFGRIGLTEDDKYVLKCQATVNDQPVTTSLPTAEKQLSSSSLAAYGKNDQKCQKIAGVACMRRENQNTREDIKSLRDSIMQTDFRNNAVNELLINIDNKNRISNESQSTQVNFNKAGNTLNRPSPFRTSEQVIRCNCSNTDYPVIKTVNNDCDAKNLKPCQSPLVIISVYPKQDNNLTDLVRTVQCAQIENKRAVFPENIYGIKAEMIKDKNITKKTRSRSPSPKVAKTRPKINKTVETRHIKTSSRNESPLRSKLGIKDPKKSTNSPKETLQFFNSNTKKVGTEKKRKPSPPRSPGTKFPQNTPNKREPQINNTSRQNLKLKQKSPKPKVDKAVNTEHLKTKKELVDSYTNKITEQMNANKVDPVKTVSTVSVNIDSENECYDVTFRQNKFTTDLKVRKTMKEASAQKSVDENGSTENFFPNISKKNTRNSVCRSICQNLSDDFKNNTPRLTLRDSLEIGHRRGAHKAIKVTQTRRPDSEQLTVNSDDMEFLAPIKHYTGDDCTICDPVERDREIRELLGVEGRRANSQFKDPQSQVFGDQISRHCFYSRQCERTLVAGFALNNLTACECVGENKKCNDANCDQSDFKIQYEDDSDKAEQLPDQKNTYNDSKKPFKQTDEREAMRKTDAEQKHQQNIDEECQCVGETRKCTLDNCEKNRQKDDDLCPCIEVSRKCNITTCEKSYKILETTDKAELPTQKNDKHSKQKEMYNKKDGELNVDRENKGNSSNQHEVPNLDRTSLYQQLTLNRNIQIFLQVEQFAKQKPIVLSKKQYNKIKKTIQHTVLGKEKSKRCVCNRSIVSVGQKSGKPNQDVLDYSNREVQTDAARKDPAEAVKESKKHGKPKKRSKKEKEQVETVVLFSNETRGSMQCKKPDRVIVKRAVSSMEIRNASVAYWKHVTFSSTNVGSIGSSSFAKRNEHSIETIFRGHKKSLTPNLGTSAFSLLSEARISESQSLKACSPDAKAKKPFLKRLMSCLVMRSGRASEKIPGPVSYPPSVNSSVDSYHISTSLGAIEMTSSIYDTSASFYSDHSIHPLSSKLKRSFFNSVRGFLTSRKS